jgi:hypothetical protein
MEDSKKLQERDKKRHPIQIQREWDRRNILKTI